MIELPNVPRISYKKFLINQEQPDRDDPNYCDFWLKHIDYCKSGVIVGGVYISGWLYYHLNFFRIPKDEKDEYGNNITVIGSPVFRDNEFYIDYHINKARENKNNPIICFGTRRFGKSVYLTSKNTYKTFIFQHSSSLIISGSNPDLNNIIKYFNDYYENRQDCFSDIIKIGDWNRATSSDVKFEFNKMKVTKGKNKINPISYKLFPILEKPTDSNFAYSTVSLRNLEHGQVSTKEELLAGITPSDAVFDEVGKFKYKNQRSALLPALKTSDGEKRFVEFLVGTGGSIDFSEDAERDFLYTTTSGFLHCDPDEYRGLVKEEYFQYRQESEKKVGLFVPAQMSNDGGRKVEIPLSEYLNRTFTDEELEDLEGFNIWVTNWEVAKANCERVIAEEKAKSDGEGKKAQMYLPFQPEDCFLHSENNPFPADDAKKRQAYLREKGLTGEYVELDQNEDGTIIVNPSKLDIVVDYPYKGGAHEAPIVIYERPIFDNPRHIKKGTYVAGYDGTKISMSKISDSVNSIYIHKRVYGVTGYQDQLVASFAGRPNQDTKFFRQAMLLLKLYNAECLPEVDVNFTKYLKLNNAEYLLASAHGTNLRLNANSNANAENGLPSNERNKQHALKLLKEYCWQEVDTGQRDADGIPIKVKGVYRISDPMLLEEIIQFGNHKNYDRIMSYGHALIWDEELSIHNIVGSQEKVQYERILQKAKNRDLGRNKKYARRGTYRK
jgi:hypothetical protein